MQGMDISELDLENQPIEEDPLAWIHHIREEFQKKYPTIEARKAYYANFPSREEIMAKIQKRIEEKFAKGYKATDLYIPEDDD